MTKQFWIGALKRAGHAVAQSALALIGTESALIGITDVDWLRVASVALTAGIISLLKSVAIGIPEAEKFEVEEEIK